MKLVSKFFTFIHVSLSCTALFLAILYNNRIIVPKWLIYSQLLPILLKIILKFLILILRNTAKNTIITKKKRGIDMNIYKAKNYQDMSRKSRKYYLRTNHHETKLCTWTGNWFFTSWNL